MNTITPAKPRFRLAFAAAAALALLATLALAAPRADAAAKVYFPSNCDNEAYKPLNVIVTCADGKTSFQTTHWDRWGSTSAHTTGGLVFPECGDKPLYACKHYEEHEATITLSAPANCGGRRQFTRMVIKDLEASKPALRTIREHFPCGGVG